MFTYFSSSTVYSFKQNNKNKILQKGSNSANKVGLRRKTGTSSTREKPTIIKGHIVLLNLNYSCNVHNRPKFLNFSLKCLPIA